MNILSLFQPTLNLVMFMQLGLNKTELVWLTHETHLNKNCNLPFKGYNESFQY